jgi:sugar O-acyltransferase (sialic acid O-acetyltransferase NeuD family)
MIEDIFVYGAGGHSRAVAEVIRRQGLYRIACVLDDVQQPPEVLGAPWIGGREALDTLARDGIRRGIVAIGDNATRAAAIGEVDAAGLGHVTVIDPSAVIASDAVVDDGVAIMPFAFSGANSAIGRGSIVNTGGTLDHDCVLGAFAHLSAGSHTTGGCAIGDLAFVGIGSVLGKPVTIGEGTIVGAGAVVLSDLPPWVVAVGVPARVIRSRLTDAQVPERLQT